MENRNKVIVGSLVGAVAIHFAFVACGHSLGVHGGSDAGVESGLFDALIDHVSAMMDGTTTDARAGTDGGSGVDGGTCGCTTVSGQIQSVPASENPAQLIRGSLTGLSSAGSLVATGPFVLTDATSVAVNPGTLSAAILIVQPAAATCPALSATPDATPGYLLTAASDFPASVAIHGGRYAVPAGQMLCAYAIFAPSTSWAGDLQWAGFVPYS